MKGGSIARISKMPVAGLRGAGRRLARSILAHPGIQKKWGVANLWVDEIDKLSLVVRE